MEEVTQFKVDYTLFLNVAAVAVVGAMAWLCRRHVRAMDMESSGDDKHWSFQDVVTGVAILWLAGGLAVFALDALGAI